MNKGNNVDLTGLELFFILKLDDLRSLFSVVVACMVMGSFLVVLFWDEIELQNKVKKVKMVVISLIACILILAALPSTKQMAAIIILPSVLQNEKVQQLPEQLLDVLGLSVDAIKKELTDEVKKAVK